MSTLSPELQQLEAYGLLAAPQQMHRVLHRNPDDLPPPRQPRWTLHPVKSRYAQAESLSAEDLSQYQMIHQQVILEGQPASLEMLKSLKRLVATYPELPFLENLQAYVWKLSGHNEKYYQINQQMLSKYPDYLFARTNLAQYLLLQGQTSQVAELLNHTSDIGDFDAEPDRLFHISEIAAYYHVLCLWCLQTQRLPRAAYAFSLVYHPYPAFAELPYLVQAWLAQPPTALERLSQQLQSTRRLQRLKR